MIKLERILYTTDFSELSLWALPYAESFAHEYKAELHCLHVVDEAYQYWLGMSGEGLPFGPGPEETMQMARQEMKLFAERRLADSTVPLVTEVRAGQPFVEIIHYAREKQVGLIVLATHGRGGLRHVLLGGTVDKVVRKAPCPVLTIRHPEYEFVMP